LPKCGGAGSPARRKSLLYWYLVHYCPWPRRSTQEPKKKKKKLSLSPPQTPPSFGAQEPKTTKPAGNLNVSWMVHCPLSTESNVGTVTREVRVSRDRRRRRLPRYEAHVVQNSAEPSRGLGSGLGLSRQAGPHGCSPFLPENVVGSRQASGASWGRAPSVNLIGLQRQMRRT
jgi:hypothetical protein